MKAIKLFNKSNGESAFIKGNIPELQHINASYFFAQSTIEPYELSLHNAPRYQFVVTLKGKLEFTVSNGESFIIEPGILLIANDLHGKGHSWKLIEGETWSRIYIVPEPGSEDLFKEENC